MMKISSKRQHSRFSNQRNWNWSWNWKLLTFWAAVKHCTFNELCRLYHLVLLFYFNADEVRSWGLLWEMSYASQNNENIDVDYHAGFCFFGSANIISFERQAASYSGLILGLRPANERRCYFVTTSVIGWAQTQNQHWYSNSPWTRCWYIYILHCI